MSPAIIQLFAFMTCTFLLGLFLGWALWRYGGVSKAAIEDLESKADFLKKSLEQSRMELWNLQDGKSPHPDNMELQNRPGSRRRKSKTSLPSAPAMPAQT